MKPSSTATSWPTSPGGSRPTAATALRLLRLVEAVLRDPIAGIGKPEPLKYQLAGAWSRRLTQEHRVVYLVTPTRVHFLQARYHY